MNWFKTMFLFTLFVITLMIIADLLGGPQWMMMAFIFACITNLIAYFFSDKIVLATYGAKQINPDEVPRLYSIVQELSKSANLPMPKVYLIPTPSPNAFATGRNHNHASIAVTQGTLEMLNENELRGVLAHEMSHIRHYDILIGTVAAIAASTIMLLARFAEFAFYFSSYGGERDRRGGNPLVLLLVAILGPIAALMIQMAISRSREYAADAGAKELVGNPFGLIDALRKISGYSARLPMPVNPAHAHMFIVKPAIGSGLFELFSTHPPIEKRIARLQE